MIIELAVVAGLVTAGALAARVLKRRGSEDPREGDEALEAVKRARTVVRGGPRGLRVGDVLLYANREMWLSGEIYLDEEGFALSLFPTPGADSCEWVAQLDPEAHQVALLLPTDQVPGGLVPTELPLGGLRLSLRRRGEAVVRRAGDHLPATADRASFAILQGPGDRVLIVVDFDDSQRLALVGDVVPQPMLELLGGS